MFFILAERMGFEPTVPLPVHTLSRGALSTTQPPLRMFFVFELREYMFRFVTVKKYFWFRGVRAKFFSFHDQFFWLQGRRSLANPKTVFGDACVWYDRVRAK